MPPTLSIVAYVHPEPQGSAKAFIVAGKAQITSTNTKLMPFRSEVTRCAVLAMRDANLELPMAAKHVPVRVTINAYFSKGESIPKKRIWPAVKPDIDKICRSCL